MFLSYLSGVLLTCRNQNNILSSLLLKFPEIFDEQNKIFVPFVIDDKETFKLVMVLQAFKKLT